MGHEANILEIRANRMEVRLIMNPKAPVDTERIPELIRRYQGTLKLVTGERPYFLHTDKKSAENSVPALLAKIKTLIGEIKGLQIK